jgi:hypothetical protein
MCIDTPLDTQRLGVPKIAGFGFAPDLNGETLCCMRIQRRLVARSQD